MLLGTGVVVVFAMALFSGRGSAGCSYSSEKSGRSEKVCCRFWVKSR